MEKKVLFKELDESSLPMATRLYKEAFGGEPWNDDWSDEEQLLCYIRDIACGFNALNFGLFIDGELTAVSIGSIRHWWEGTNYNIEEFFVSPEMQGQGLETSFMKMIENNIKKRGLSGIFLQTDSDKPSYGFYKKNGFNELSAHVSFYKSVKE